eukprot:GILI01040291.1.p1 GENE.GILI01040291.1~~GILI01040291.1.p1  ORF type:complete len:300 (+),score=38.32 GILI01040291.1:39-938(+)
MEVVQSSTTSPFSVSIRVDIRRAFFCSEKKCMLYDVEVQTPLSSWKIVHRYSDFFRMHKQLSKDVKKIALPSLPGKKLWRNLDPEFIEERLKKLVTYLKSTINIDEVLQHPSYQQFLGLDRLKTGNNAPPEGLPPQMLSRRSSFMDDGSSVMSDTYDFQRPPSGRSVTPPPAGAFSRPQSPPPQFANASIYQNSTPTMEPGEQEKLEALQTQEVLAVLLRASQLAERHVEQANLLANVKKEVRECRGILNTVEQTRHDSDQVHTSLALKLQKLHSSQAGSSQKAELDQVLANFLVTNQK